MKKKTAFIVLFCSALLLLSIILIISRSGQDKKSDHDEIMAQASLLCRGEESETIEVNKLIDRLSVFAENGDDDAQVMLGIIYIGTQKTLPEVNKAIYWFQKAADSGNPVGQTALGEYYLKKADTAKGIMLIKSAAESGYAPAQMLYGDLFFNGTGCNVDYQKAYTWYTTAIEQIPYYEAVLPGLDHPAIKKSLKEKAEKALEMLNQK